MNKSRKKVISKLNHKAYQTASMLETTYPLMESLVFHGLVEPVSVLKNYYGKKKRQTVFFALTNKGLLFAKEHKL